MSLKQEARVEERLHELERRSQHAGQPVTIQRRAALRALVRRTDHPTAEAVYADVVREVPGVAKATVYRALDNLVQLGLARKVEHAGSVARFDGRTDRHHHLICRQCGSITDVSWESLESVPMPDVTGFELHDFAVNFQGHCSDCNTHAGDT